MAYPQITFKIATILVLFSILYLRTHAVISGSLQHDYVGRRDLVCGLSTLNVSSCSKVCVTAFWDEQCVDEVAPFGDSRQPLKYGGAIKPLILASRYKAARQRNH